MDIKGKTHFIFSFPRGIVALLLHTFFSWMASSSCLNSSVALKIFCSAFSISSCSCDSRVCAANFKKWSHTHKKHLKFWNSTRFPFFSITSSPNYILSLQSIEILKSNYLWMLSSLLNLLNKLFHDMLQSYNWSIYLFMS